MNAYLCIGVDLARTRRVAGDGHSVVARGLEVVMNLPSSLDVVIGSRG